MTWKDIIDLILIPFKFCFDIIGQPVLEGISVLEILIAFIIILILIKMVIPIAHMSLDGGFSSHDSNKSSNDSGKE